MSDYIWVSSARTESRLIKLVETDISETKVDMAVEGQNLNSAGLPVPADLCPQFVWAAPGTKLPEKMPKLFWAMSQFIVTEDAARILSSFELGGGALHAVAGGVFQSNRKTRLPGIFFSWIFGNKKSAFRLDRSPGARPPDMPGRWAYMPYNLNDTSICVSRDALDGPDVWVDPTLFKSLFLSRPLGDALVAARMQKAFCLTRCDVAYEVRCHRKV